ncbi:MAG TPA: pyridoxal phosphate-dependent aminotransferase [Candidatus Sumerlaeota bacterium]|nr:pyridoxal phosphate-dependent aminotransferase [Candidatus Sumerlaeota bacterium]
MKISKRAQKVTQSLTLALSAKAKQMKKEGMDVVGFGAGEPDFDTPDHIKAVAIEDIRKGATKYTPASGTPELKKAVADKIKQDYGLVYDPSQIIISPGAKFSLYVAIMAICDDGDEIIIPAPYWLTYPEQVKAAGGVPVYIEAGIATEFKITPEQLKKSITPKTCALILNSPSNPTGAVYTRAELEAIADVVKETGIIVISDEIYDKLVYDGMESISFPTVRPGLQDQTILVNGHSKTYSMTGWRIGWTAGPKDVIAAMGRLQSHSTSNPTTFCQRASAVALTADQSCIEEMRRAFEERRNYMVARLRAMPGVKCAMPGGAFYVFPDVSSFYGRKLAGRPIGGSMDMANILLEEFKVGVVPGDPFGDDRCVRLSYALGMKDIEKGLDRIEEALKQVE